MTRYAVHVRNKMNAMRAAAVHGLMEKPGSIETTVNCHRISCVARWTNCASRDLYRFSWFLDGRCVKASEAVASVFGIAADPVVSTTYLEGFGA